MQDFLIISSEPQVRNLQVPSAAIDMRSTEVKSLLQSLLSIVVNINKLPTQVLVQLQQGAYQALVDKKNELSDGYVQSQNTTKKLQEEAKELWKIKEQLGEEKEWDIAAFKQMQVELQRKGTNEISELKKEQECLIFKKAHLYGIYAEVEQTVDKDCQHIYQRTKELISVAKVK